MALRADHVDLDRDRALVQRYQAGDGAAFDELYRRYHDRLERFCLKRVGDPHTAEEIAQEAFTRALVALPAFGGNRHFYPWVSVIAGRLCVDHHRREARRAVVAVADPALIGGGEDEVLDAVDDAIVVQAMARLGPRHQDVLRLREVHGWSYRQIADHYRVPVGTVETLLFRARRALRREFRVIDGGGLVAVPIVGWLIQLVARARDRLAPMATLADVPAGAAAAASATIAAAVAIVVIPGVTPVRAPPPQRPPVVARAKPVGRAGGVAPPRAGSPAAAAHPGPADELTGAPSSSAAATSSAPAGHDATLPSAPSSGLAPSAPAPDSIPAVPNPAGLIDPSKVLVTTGVAGRVGAPLPGPTAAPPAIGGLVPTVLGPGAQLAPSVPTFAGQDSGSAAVPPNASPAAGGVLSPVPGVLVNPVPLD